MIGSQPSGIPVDVRRHGRGRATMTTIKAIEANSVSDLCTAPGVCATPLIFTPQVHQIQSGQVIVDLCSVAKELVENGLDAGATSIGTIPVLPASPLKL